MAQFKKFDKNTTKTFGHTDQHILWSKPVLCNGNCERHYIQRYIPQGSSRCGANLVKILVRPYLIIHLKTEEGPAPQSLPPGQVSPAGGWLPSIFRGRFPWAPNLKFRWILGTVWWSVCFIKVNKQTSICKNHLSHRTHSKIFPPHLGKWLFVLAWTNFRLVGWWWIIQCSRHSLLCALCEQLVLCVWPRLSPSIALSHLNCRILLFLTLLWKFEIKMIVVQFQ